MENKDLILDVPYFSQYLEIKDRDLSITSCGITGVYMVFNFYQNIGKLNTKIDTLETMAIEGKKDPNGYQKNVGWKHDYFVNLANKIGLNAHRMEKMEEITTIEESILKGFPVVVSVERKCLSSISFHMVVIIGVKYSISNKLQGFYYHDPASIIPNYGKGRFVLIKEFKFYWRKMAIFIKPKET